MFISQAHAQASGGAFGGDIFGLIVPLVLMMGVFWLFLIRPQQKRVREHQEMISNIRRGDTVVTNGGIIGKVAKVVDDREIMVDVAENVRMRFQKAAVAEVRVKGEPAKEETAAKPSK